MSPVPSPRRALLKIRQQPRCWSPPTKSVLTLAGFLQSHGCSEAASSWPRVTATERLMSHVYKEGQLVRTTGRDGAPARGVYEVIRLMPPGPGGVPQYRVKGAGGERVVHEKELAKA